MKRSFTAAALALSALMPQLAAAALLTQSKDFDFHTAPLPTGGTGPTTGKVTIVPSGGWTASISMFDGSLGSLNSMTIVWAITAHATGVAAGTGSSGNIDAFGGGRFAINGNLYGGAGFTDSNGAASGNTITLDATTGQTRVVVPNDTHTNEYPADLLARLTGPGHFDVLWSPGFTTFDVRNINNFQGSLTGSVSVTFDYTVADTPATVPEPATWALVAVAGLAVSRRRGRSGGSR